MNRPDEKFSHPVYSLWAKVKITVYPFIYERVNRYTVNFVVMLTTSATYGKMFLDRKGCGRRWIEALKERGYGWRLRVVCDWQQK